MKFKSSEETSFQKIDLTKKYLKKNNCLNGCTFQDLDFTKVNVDWPKFDTKDASFLGCTFPKGIEDLLRKNGALIIAKPKDIPYNPFRKNLYTWQELMEGYSAKKDNSFDLKVYENFSKSKFRPIVLETMWQRIHDHAMDDALRDLLKFDESGMTRKKCVGFMGGHGTLRTDLFYKKTAFTAKLLAEKGYFIVSGGGPGIMEATNLGAYFAKRSNKDLEFAIELLSKAPHFSHKDFHNQSLKVLKKFPNGKPSLAIPTWFYGHEPSNLFASHIAKYFSNSIREDTLLAISLFGIVCAPGSAGTTQEIFMDATQNHYGTFNYYSPMIFLGKKRYEIDTFIYPLLKQLAHGRKYADLLHITDEPEEVLRFLKKNPPIKVEEKH